jgi:catechol 2,3-dioxygenase-like lactoylglutathione lyase family enzyme
MRIGLTSMFVDDQDQAEWFSTEKLGFRVKTAPTATASVG